MTGPAGWLCRRGLDRVRRGRAWAVRGREEPASGAPQVSIKGEYGTATLTDHGESIVATLKSRGHATLLQRYSGVWGRNFGVVQAASAAAHGPDADLCVEGPDGLCPHAEIECEQIDAYDLGLTDDPGCWTQEVPGLQ